jgi:hypothetical protein
MSESIRKDQWVWVVVQDPGGQEQFLGQYDQEKDVSFIPLFLEKEEAQQCLNIMPHETGHTYEVQAIRYDDLSGRAVENGFMLFVLNGAGEVVDKIKP